MFQILDLLSKEKLRSFSTLKSKYYRIHDSGFYVYAKKCEKQDDDSTEKCIYTSRPALAESHIIRYEDDRKMIRWWYNRHEDDVYVGVYEDVHSFHSNFLLHYPDEKYWMKCIKCGYEENVPAWIVGEFADENKAGDPIIYPYSCIFSILDWHIEILNK